jgi:hypothetical protein
MPYGSYTDDAAREWGGRRATALRAAAVADVESAVLGSIEDDAQRAARLSAILATPTAAVRDAKPAAGRFPVVLHVPGATTQSVLLEYLASHGYVVLSVPLYNAAPAFQGRADHTPASLLDTTEDLAWMLGEAERLPSADVSRAAAIGMFAQAGLALQMRGTPLAAIACLECGDNETLKPLPFYDPARVRIPVLELRSSSWNGAMDQAPFTQGLRAATRYVGRFTSLGHPDFFPFAKLAGQPTASRHDAVAVVARAFLDATLKGDAHATAFLQSGGPLPGLPADSLQLRVLGAEDLPPTAAEFLGWLRFGDMYRVRAAWDRFGAALVERDRMFAAVLFLARDGAPQAADAVAMFRRGFPLGDDVRRREQEEMLTRLLGERTR